MPSTCLRSQCPLPRGARVVLVCQFLVCFLFFYAPSLLSAKDELVGVSGVMASFSFCRRSSAALELPAGRPAVSSLGLPLDTVTMSLTSGNQICSDLCIRKYAFTAESLLFFQNDKQKDAEGHCATTENNDYVLVQLVGPRWRRVWRRRLRLVGCPLAHIDWSIFRLTYPLRK